MIRRYVKRFTYAACAALLWSASSAANAQVPKGLDGKQPVEINADTLEVFQQENKAIFTGNVIAIQGKTRLRSERMTVFYKRNENSKPADPNAPEAAAGAANITQSAVERILVEQKVLLTTPEESASGDNGVYDVSNKTVTLLGDVTLTRGKNVLKGKSLVYDFVSGRSVINSPQHTPEGTNPGTGSTGRVRALFVPEKDKGR